MLGILQTYLQIKHNQIFKRKKRQQKLCDEYMSTGKQESTVRLWGVTKYICNSIIQSLTTARHIRQ